VAILIEEAADYFICNSKSISKVELIAQDEVKSAAKKNKGSAMETNDVPTISSG
jgi:hypothetical protein